MMESSRVTRSRSRQSVDAVIPVITLDEEMEEHPADVTPDEADKLDTSSQTTPGLLNNGNTQDTNSTIVVSSGKASDDEDDEDQSCPICFEPWDNSGNHRITSLACGHLFGRSCIERWLKEPKNKSCPQCKASAKRKDIRNIYAKALKARDTTDRDQAKQDLVQEKYKRSIAEENEAKALLKYQLLKMEMEKLKAEIQESSSQPTCSISHERHQIASSSASSSTRPLSSSQNSPRKHAQFNTIQNVAESKKNLAPITKSYSFQKVIPVSQKEARVIAYEKCHMLLTVSRPSQNQLFNGYGILKISSLDAKSTEFIAVHQKQVRDMKFNQTGDQLILTGSMDKSLKITNVCSNSVVQSYTCPAPIWACAWNERNTNYIYAGLQNGSCIAYDTRKTNEELAVIKPRTGTPCPIVSLSYIPTPSNENISGTEGLIVGTLKGGWFVENKEDDTSMINHISHPLLFPDGSYNNLTFDPVTRQVLISQRPGRQSSRNCHSIYDLKGIGTLDNPFHVNKIQQCFGGNRAQNLTKSHLYPCPDDNSRLMLCAGDEASSSTIIWDGDRGNELQKLTCAGGTIFDVTTFEAYDSDFLVALTEQKLNFFKWQ